MKSSNNSVVSLTELYISGISFSISIDYMYKINQSIQARSFWQKMFEYNRNIITVLLFFLLINVAVSDDIIGKAFSNGYNTNLAVDDNLTVHNFQQGNWGNCGLVSSMATLAINKDLRNKIIPGGQNFEVDNSSNVVFNLYKLGKIHKVKVDKSLPIDGYGLTYGKRSSANLVGLLLEKALVQLHFDGNYESSVNVEASFVLTSLSNNFFEDFLFPSGNTTYEPDEVLDHGFKTNSQMVSSFHDAGKSSQVMSNHAYTVVGENGAKKKQVKLYNPHGKILSVDKSIFNETSGVLTMSYYDNKIFQIPEIKTSVEFIGNWQLLKNDKNFTFVDYDLLIEEEDTDILINVVSKPSVDVKPLFFIVNNDYSIVSSNTANGNSIFHKASLRASLKRGKYKVVVALASWERSRKFLENGGNEFLFRLAASKQCSVEKSTNEENERINEVLESHFITHVLNVVSNGNLLFNVMKNLATDALLNYFLGV